MLFRQSCRAVAGFRERTVSTISREVGNSGGRVSAGRLPRGNGRSAAPGGPSDARSPVDLRGDGRRSRTGRAINKNKRHAMKCRWRSRIADVRRMAELLRRNLPKGTNLPDVQPGRA